MRQAARKFSAGLRELVEEAQAEARTWEGPFKGGPGVLGFLGLLRGLRVFGFLGVFRDLRV